MNQHYYNAYSHFCSQRKMTMPFLAGGYTQADWNLVSGNLVDTEFMDDYLPYPKQKYDYINKWTKPYWA